MSVLTTLSFPFLWSYFFNEPSGVVRYPSIFCLSFPALSCPEKLLSL
jgi:hypothetical protein